MAILDHLQSEVALLGLTEESLVLQGPVFLLCSSQNLHIWSKKRFEGW